MSENRVKPPVVSIRVLRSGMLSARVDGATELAEALMLIINQCYQIHELQRFARETDDSTLFSIQKLTNRDALVREFYSQVTHRLGPSSEFKRRIDKSGFITN